MNALIGGLLAVLTAAVAFAEWGAGDVFWWMADALVLPLLALLAVGATRSGKLFLVVGGCLSLAAFGLRGDGLSLLDHALQSAAFIAAFFTALATLRNVSASSASIAHAGRFLAQQPPGRRYLALTLGGQLFGLLLNYGALVLLGGLAEANARTEPDAEIRRHRIRRMLLAIQRGFVATLPWSPIAFAMAISTSVIPGADWADAALPCLVSGLIVASVGWAMDSIFKPKLSRPAPTRRPPEGSWSLIWPLIFLLFVLTVGVISFQMLGDVRTVAAVMVVVPLLSLAWLIAQKPDPGPDGASLATRLIARVQNYLTLDLPGYRSELLLLMMAGFIGSLGGKLLLPVMATSGVDLSVAPAWLLLLGLVWVIPLTGQIGMNPILSVSLIGPLLPAAADMGVAPADIILAITAGWALSGASSPYTATTLLIGSMGGVSAEHVGRTWNGAYTLVCGVALSGWVLVNVAT
ncbi:MAG: hypothetical protein AAFR28_09645 [Pseudomonadota bacterium]